MLSAVQKIRLLTAIETNSLVFLCGAGLSMSSPSFLPSAGKIAADFYDDWQAIEALPPAARVDLDVLAGIFYTRGDFSAFLNRVPWDSLSGAPNLGHAAIADFLVSGAAAGALSANFDTMIERWAQERKVDVEGALTGQEAVNFAHVSRPLVKFHGCMTRGKDQTLWTQEQLVAPAVQDRIASCSAWMALNLPGKHLVVVGFWSDWGYLNDVLADAFNVQNAASVLVIDPQTDDELQGKAPLLWGNLNAASNIFEHVQGSADEVLHELRSTFSTSWARRFYALGSPAAVAMGIAVDPAPDTMTCDDVYNLRRDAEGSPYTKAATLSRPPQSASQSAALHYQLMAAGAVRQESWFELNGQTIRIVNGAGQALASVKDTFREPAALPAADIVVCSGSENYGVPAVITGGTGLGSVARRGYSGSRWITGNEAPGALGL